MTTTYILDCSDCVGAESERCDDCLVRFLVERVPGSPVLVSEEEARAIQVFADAGMLPARPNLRAVS